MPKQTGSIDLSSQKQAHDDASKTATNYIRADSTGIRIANSNPANASAYQHQTSQKTEFVVNGIIASDVSSDGLRIYNRKYTGLYNTDSVMAHFGESSHIGFKSSIHTDISDLGFDVSSGPDKLFSVEIDESDEIKYNIIHYWMSTDDSNNTYATIPANSTGSYTATFSRTALDSYSDYLTTRVWKYSDETYWHSFVTNEGTPLTNGYASISSENENDDVIMSYEEGWTNTSSKAVNIAYASVSDSRNAIMTLGRSNTSILKLDYHSLQMIDKEGDPYLYISDLRDASGTVNVVDTFYGDGVTYRFYLNYRSISTSYTVEVSDSSGGTISTDYDVITFNNAPTDGAVITATYTTASQFAKAFTFGTRQSNSFIGGYSFSVGYNNIASGYISHAEGRDVQANGSYSHAEGQYTTANGSISHAEGSRTNANGSYSHAEGSRTNANGRYSHAEGEYTIANGQHSHAEGSDTEANGGQSHAEGYNTEANGNYSHAEGCFAIASGYISHAEGSGTKAIGYYSHAQNAGTIANGDNQTAIGRFNIQDDNNNYAFIIGNGSNANNRSNALTVDWNGSINLPSHALAQNGTGYCILGTNVKTSDETNDTSANLWGTALEIRDHGNNQRSYVRHFETTGNHQGIQIETRRYINNAWVYNGLRLSVDGTGALAVAVASGTSWRNAIFGVTNGIVPESLGGTGCTSLQATRAAMGLGNTLGAVPVAAGGSGMTACAQGNISPASGVTVGNLVYRCWGKVVTIYMYNIKFTAAVANNGSHAVGTVPSGYRPSYISFAQVATNKLTGLAYMRIDTSGNITFNNQSGGNLAASSTVSCTLTYVAT